MTAGRRRLAVWLILIWAGGAGLVQAWRFGMTSDEGIHAASAYLALTRGEHRFDPEHPFLFKYLTALPLLALHPAQPEDDARLWEAAKPTLYDSWREARTWADRWIYDSDNDARRMLFLMRLPGVGALVLLLLLVHRMARRWIGEAAALWSLFIAAFTPTLLGHGATANTDVPLALTMLLTVRQMARYAEQPDRRHAAYLGLAAAIALNVKFSAVALVPALAAWLAVLMRRKTLTARQASEAAGSMLALFWALTWILYGVRSPVSLVTAPQGSYVFDGIAKTLRAGGLDVGGTLRAAGYLLPTAYLKGLALVLAGGAAGRPAFLFGTWYPAGVPWYFPVLFLLKTPPALLAIGAAAVATAKPYRNWGDVSKAAALVTMAFGTLALTSKLNLGIRHISPLLPLFALAAGGAAAVLFRGKRLLAAAFAVAVAAPVLVQSGDLIAYGNAFVAARGPAYRTYEDSNLDWGQQYRAAGEALSGCRAVAVPYDASILRYYGVARQVVVADGAAVPSGAVLMLNAGQLRSAGWAGYQAAVPIGQVGETAFFYGAEPLARLCP